MAAHGGTGGGAVEDLAPSGAQARKERSSMGWLRLLVAGLLASICAPAGVAAWNAGVTLFHHAASGSPMTAQREVPLDKLLTEDRCPQLRTSYRVDPWTADVVVGEGGTRVAAKDLLGGQRAACLALKPSNLAATVTATVPVGAGYLLAVLATGALWVLVMCVISQTAWRFFETMGSDPRTLFDHADDQLRRLGTIRSWSLAGLALWATSLLFSPLDFDGRMFVALPVLALGALGTLPAKHVFRRAAQLQLDEEATV